MPLLTATSAFRLGRIRWSSPQQCYLQRNMYAQTDEKVSAPHTGSDGEGGELAGQSDGQTDRRKTVVLRFLLCTRGQRYNFHRSRQLCGRNYGKHRPTKYQCRYSFDGAKTSRLQDHGKHELLGASALVLYAGSLKTLSVIVAGRMSGAKACSHAADALNSAEFQFAKCS